MPPAPFKGNLIVTNLPPDMTGLQLAELFDSYGLVIGAEIRHIPAMTGTATIGVVALAPEDAVERAIKAVNRSLIGDRQVKVGRAKERPKKPKSGVEPRGAASSGRTLSASFPAAPALAPGAQPAKPVIVEYKPRRRSVLAG